MTPKEWNGLTREDRTLEKLGQVDVALEDCKRKRNNPGYVYITLQEPCARADRKDLPFPADPRIRPVSCLLGGPMELHYAVLAEHRERHRCVICRKVKDCFHVSANSAVSSKKVWACEECYREKWDKAN